MTTVKGYRLETVTTDEQFTPLFIAFRDGFTNPGNALWPLFIGDWRPEDEASRQAALEEGTARLRSWHRADPTSTWLQVVEESTGSVVAGGRWSVYKSDPHHGSVEASWFPEGDPRRIATELINYFLASAARHATKPHVFLNILFTQPEHRRKGCAKLIMDWGFEQARKNELPVFIEATVEGKPLYEAYGMKTIGSDELKLDEATLPPTNDPELRKELIKQLMPFKWWSMWKDAPV